MSAEPAPGTRRSPRAGDEASGAEVEPGGERRTGWIARILIAPVRVWQWTAPARVPRCRFHPSCSAYAVGALREHGALRGVWLALRRLLRCHPWNPGGIDPVPPSEDR